MMNWRRTTSPVVEPIHLTEAKLHLRVDSTDDDTLIRLLVAAARGYVEAWTWRQMVCATWTAKLSTLIEHVIELPRPPLIAVSSITYVDSAGTTQTVAAADYSVNTHSDIGFIEPAYNETWPTARGYTDDVVITYNAGYLTQIIPTVAVGLTPGYWTMYGRAPVTGTVVRLSNSGGALPAGFVVNTDYYIVGASGQTFGLSATSGGAALDVNAIGAGTHFVGVLPESLRVSMLLMLGTMYEQRSSLVERELKVNAALKALLSPYSIPSSYFMDD